jgi:hypothetical protein
MAPGADAGASWRLLTDSATCGTIIIIIIADPRSRPGAAATSYINLRKLFASHVQNFDLRYGASSFPLDFG